MTREHIVLVVIALAALAVGLGVLRRAFKEWNETDD